MKIKASVELTTEELLAILTNFLSREYDVGRSYSRLPGGEALELILLTEGKWLIEWGDKPELAPEPISPPVPVAPEEKGTTVTEDDVPF